MQIIPIDVYGMPSASFEDFDNDGDMDIICVEFLDKFTYFENIVIEIILNIHQEDS